MPNIKGMKHCIDIRTGRVIRGSLPKKAVKIINEWTKENQDKLLENWEKAIALKPLEKIKGADND